MQPCHSDAKKTVIRRSCAPSSECSQTTTSKCSEGDGSLSMPCNATAVLRLVPGASLWCALSSVMMSESTMVSPFAFSSERNAQQLQSEIKSARIDDFALQVSCSESSQCWQEPSATVKAACSQEPKAYCLHGSCCLRIWDVTFRRDRQDFARSQPRVSRR